MLKLNLGADEDETLMTKRGRIEIIAQILAFCAQPRLKTQIMYKTNITFNQFKSYATLLSSLSLLAHQSQKYVATEKGHQFVQAFNRMQTSLGGVMAGRLTEGSPPTMRKSKTPFGEY